MHASLHGADTLSDGRAPGGGGRAPGARAGAHWGLEGARLSGTTTLVLRSTFSKMTYPELMTMLNVTTAALGADLGRISGK